MGNLNGRFNINEDNYTSVSLRGKAVVDYICVPHDILEQCNDFKVITSRSIIENGNLVHLLGERSKTPDHSAMVIEFRTLHSVLSVTFQRIV